MATGNDVTSHENDLLNQLLALNMGTQFDVFYSKIEIEFKCVLLYLNSLFN